LGGLVEGESLKKTFEYVSTIVSVMMILLALTVFVVPHFGLQVYTTLSGSMNPSLNTGDMVVTKNVSPNEVQVGDIITYRSPVDGRLTTHRVVEIKRQNRLLFRTKGDANDDADPYLVPPQNILGKVFFILPLLGYITRFIKTPFGLILTLLIPGFTIIGMEVENIRSEIKARKKPLHLTTKKHKENLKIASLVIIGLSLMGSSMIGHFASFSNQEVSEGNSFEAWVQVQVFFLVGTKTPELSKFDDVTWTSTTPPGSMGEIYSMDHNGDYWLIGDSNKYVWKYDGQTFNDVSPSSTQFNDKIYAISWGDGYWLVGDSTGTIQKYDGSSWTDLTSSAGFYSEGSPIDEIKWNQDFGYWLVGGKYVVKKFDGSIWTDISPSSRAFEEEIGGIGCNGSIWLVGDWKGVIQQFDGSTWTDLTSNAGFYSNTDSIYTIEWGNNKFLVGAKSGKIKTYDGNSWTDKSSGWGSSNDIYTIEWSNEYSYWLIGGKIGIIKSFNGSSWTDKTSDAGFSDDVRAISSELNG